MVTTGFKGSSMRCSLNIFFEKYKTKMSVLASQHSIFKTINKASVQAWWVGLHSSMELYIDIV